MLKSLLFDKNVINYKLKYMDSNLPCYRAKAYILQQWTKYNIRSVGYISVAGSDHGRLHRRRRRSYFDCVTARPGHSPAHSPLVDRWHISELNVNIQYYEALFLLFQVKVKCYGVLYQYKSQLEVFVLDSLGKMDNSIERSILSSSSMWDQFIITY